MCQAMTNQTTVIDISFKNVLRDIARTLGFPKPLYGCLNNTSFNACVAIPPKEGVVAYFKIGEQCRTLLESEEDVVGRLVCALAKVYNLHVCDLSDAKQQEIDLAAGVFA